MTIEIFKRAIEAKMEINSSKRCFHALEIKVVTNLTLTHANLSMR